MLLPNFPWPPPLCPFLFQILRNAVPFFPISSAYPQFENPASRPLYSCSLILPLPVLASSRPLSSLFPLFSCDQFKRGWSPATSCPGSLFLPVPKEERPWERGWVTCPTPYNAEAKVFDEDALRAWLII